MKSILLFLFSICALGLSAQAPDRFYTRFGGDGDDIGYSGKPTFEGQYIVVGSSSSYGVAGNTDVYLVKVDIMGFPVWEKYIGGLGNDIGRSVIQIADSGFVIAGYSNSFGAGGYDVYIIRTDKNGNIVWQKTFGGQDWDFAYDLVQASDGNIFVVGNTQSFGSGKKDGYLLKLDLAGNVLLQKYFGGLENDELNSIIKTNDNYLATVGYTESRGEINGDGYFLKLNLNADTLFTKTFGGAYKDYACDLVQKGSTENYDYFISGAKTYSTLSAKTHAYMYKMSATGNFLLDADYFKNGDNEEFTSITNSLQLPNLTGFVRTASFPDFKTQGEILITDPTGFYYKINDQGGLEDEYFHSIESTKDGGYLILGSTNSYNSQSKDVFLVKHDSTCFFYTSVVDLREEEKNIEPSIYYKENNVIGILFFENSNPQCVNVISITGELIKKIVKNSENAMEINLSEFPNSVYLLSFTHNNKMYYKKVVVIH